MYKGKGTEMGARDDGSLLAGRLAALKQLAEDRAQNIAGSRRVCVCSAGCVSALRPTKLQKERGALPAELPSECRRESKGQQKEMGRGKGLYALPASFPSLQGRERVSMRKRKKEGAARTARFIPVCGRVMRKGKTVSTVLFFPTCSEERYVLPASLPLPSVRKEDQREVADGRKTEGRTSAATCRVLLQADLAKQRTATVPVDSTGVVCKESTGRESEKEGKEVSFPCSVLFRLEQATPRTAVAIPGQSAARVVTGADRGREDAAGGEESQPRSRSSSSSKRTHPGSSFPRCLIQRSRSATTCRHCKNPRCCPGPRRSSRRLPSRRRGTAQRPRAKEGQRQRGQRCA